MSEEIKDVENNNGSQEVKTKFTDLLKLLAIVTGVAGSLYGIKIMADTTFESVIGWLYVIAGVSSFALWWSMAIIVAAAQRYLDKNGEVK